MKLKHIYSILFIALLGFMTSCDDDDSITLLNEIQVSSSYVAIPQTGGSQTITVTAKDSWSAEKVTTDKDKVEWLNISTTSGSAGETSMTFSAESTVDGRTAQVKIKSGGKTQFINIIQGESTIEEVTVAVAKQGPDGKTYRVTGVCVEIQNTEYGNWILEDETGSILVYGTLDAKGNSKNFLSLDIEVGDEVTIEGPRGSYAGDPQFVDVMVINLEKSKVAINDVENAELPVEGGIFTAHLTVKGEGLSVDIPADAKEWLSIASIESEGEDITVNFQAAPNMGGDRQTTIIFRTKDEAGKNYSAETVLKQEGAIVKATIAEFLAAEEDLTQYRLSGVITRMAHAFYGNVDLKDFSGQTYVYGLDNYTEGDLKAGDIITIVGRRASHNGNPQVAGGVLEDTKPVSAVENIADFLSKEVDANVYYMVTGKIKDIADEAYGNMTLEDESGEIYAFGCYPGYGATGDDRKGAVAEHDLKVGDTVTIIGTRGSYKEVDQLGNGFYFSHESAVVE